MALAKKDAAGKFVSGGEERGTGSFANAVVAAGELGVGVEEATAVAESQPEAKAASAERRRRTVVQTARSLMVGMVTGGTSKESGAALAGRALAIAATAEDEFERYYLVGVTGAAAALGHTAAGTAPGGMGQRAGNMEAAAVELRKVGWQEMSEHLPLQQRHWLSKVRKLEYGNAIEALGGLERGDDVPRQAKREE